MSKETCSQSPLPVLLPRQGERGREGGREERFVTCCLYTYFKHPRVSLWSRWLELGQLGQFHVAELEMHPNNMKLPKPLDSRSCEVRGRRRFGPKEGGLKAGTQTGQIIMHRGALFRSRVSKKREDENNTSRLLSPRLYAKPSATKTPTQIKNNNNFKKSRLIQQR